MFQVDENIQCIRYLGDHLLDTQFSLTLLIKVLSN